MERATSIPHMFIHYSLSIYNVFLEQMPSNTEDIENMLFTIKVIIETVEIWLIENI